MFIQLKNNLIWHFQIPYLFTYFEFALIPDFQIF